LHARAGIVRALHAYDGARVVESTTPFTSGASGGALFDAQGRLIGILTYRLRGDRRSYFSVPVEWFASRVAGSQPYVAVAPLEGAGPFWQRPQAGLPFFLRAHQLETGGDWSGLLDLTEEWSKAEDTNAEAWLFRGRGLVETQDLAGAQLAFEHAVALDPVSSAAWLQLGRLCAHRGLIAEAEDALSQLNRLNPELAQCLAVEMRTAPAAAQLDNPALDVCSAL
jgi:tetratricopeptide (TPR) repeat protein